MDYLKPCPFCGGRASARRFAGKFFDVYKVYCMNEDCYIEPATRPYYSKKEAIEAWNRRLAMAHLVDNADSYICSACGYECNNPNKEKYGAGVCPKCGAKMDLEEV